MLHDRLVSALQKAGATVTEKERYFSGRVDAETRKFHKQFEATLNGQRIDWYTQENWNEKLGDHDGRLAVSHVTKRSPHTDAMTDCFCDSYSSNIKGAVYLLTRTF